MISVLVSEMADSQYRDLVRQELISQMRNPDPGSEFDRMRPELKRLDDDHAIKLLLSFNYDGIVLIGDMDKAIYGETFFQAHYGNELHMFACWVHPHRRKIGIGTLLVRGFLEHAWLRGFRTVRIGAGNEKERAMHHILDNLIQQREIFLGFRIVRCDKDGKGWLCLIPAEETVAGGV
jgi:ribosomal protein S18 acetylase RimI-like enzyme